ncbi:MAG: TolC family protein [Deltaproteobacteria bacterium]|nr:TolC family protein [Deltaproteobacteria bacterium]
MASVRSANGRAAHRALALIAVLLAPATVRGETTTSTAGIKPLGLSDLLRLAQRHNKQVGIDVAKIEEARALYSFAKAQAFPKFSGRALLGGPTAEARSRIPNDLSTTTPASFEGDFDFGKLGITFRFDANGAQPLYTFGKIASARDAARALVRASEEKVHITEGEVLLNVQRAFWAHQMTRSFVKSLQEGEATLAKVVTKIEELLAEESPQVTENDRLRMLHARATVGVRLLEAENAANATLAALSLLTGQPQNKPLVVSEADLDAVPQAPPPIEELLVQARAARPEIKALTHLVHATERYLDFRANSLFPDLFIGAFIESAITTNATDQTNPFLNDRFNYFDAGVGLGLRWELDVFDKLALLEDAKAKLTVKIAETAAADEAIELEVRKLHLDVLSNHAKLVPAERAYRAARGWLTAAVLAYDIGTGEAAELIDAFLAAATAEADLRKTQYDLLTGTADLDRAVGHITRGAPE